MAIQRLSLSCPAPRMLGIRRYLIVTRAAANSFNIIHQRCPFDQVTAELGFLPTPDPLQRLALSQLEPAAAEWEAALRELPKLAVAAEGTNRTSVTATTTTAASATATASTVGRGPLRRALESLPPFPIDKLLSSTSAISGLPAGVGTTAVAAATAAAGPDGVAAAAGEELWRAYTLLSFLAHAYMWCEPGRPPAVLPAVLAIPWVRVAAAVDMPPVLTYATYNLYNWRRLDPSGPVRLGNIVCLQNFLGGPDEEWFRLVHVEIEARAGRAVAGLEALQQAARQDDSAAVLAGLVHISEALRDMQATLARMGEKCDPYIYYNRVRKPMSGWRNNPDLPQGLVYGGVSSQPIQLYGETGAQSSVLHAFDAALGVKHDQVWLRDYLDTMVLHMPPAHRTFLHRLAAANDSDTDVRSYVQRHASQTTAAGTAGGGSVCGGGAAAVSGSELRDAYNLAIEEMERFRSQHRAFAYSYIAKWARHETKGTGGSDFMPALTGYRDDTIRHLLL